MRENVYQMYVANGNRAGFCVRRSNWMPGNYARVVSVDGHESGPLNGRAPYFDSPTVLVDFCNADGTVSARDQVLSCPGNYSYTRFDPNDR